MHPRARAAALTIGVLLVAAGAMVSYKLFRLGYSIDDVVPRKEYRVVVAMTFDGQNGDVRVRTFLPLSDPRQTVRDETNDGPGTHLATRIENGNRTAVWTAGSAPDNTSIRFAFNTLVSPISYDVADGLALPDIYPANIATFLRPEKDIQADDPIIAKTLVSIGADKGSAAARLRRIFAKTESLRGKSFKGTTDAITALRLGEASCNGKSRLFVALARASGIPSRLVGGIILDDGSKRTSHQWAEAYVGGHWVPFCPTNGYFAALPASYLTLYRGDESLFRHSSDINFDYHFEIESRLVPSPRAKESFRLINGWAMFERLGLPFGLLKTVLMLPFGALIVVLFRNVIGMPTFGTFLPALVAAAATETGIGWGLVGLVLVVFAVALLRWFFQKLQLLHSPTLAILLTGVAVTMLGISLLAERVGLPRLAQISLFPVAVLAITAERFYLALTEQGTVRACKELSGTLIVIVACHVVMGSLALQILVIGFPEVLLVVVAANIYLGRWVGVRVSEYMRFRQLLVAPEEAS